MTNLRVYGSFEEFEREELRPGSTFDRSVGEVMEDRILQELELDFEAPEGVRRRKWDDDLEEEEEAEG